MIAKLRPLLDPYIGLMLATVVLAALFPAEGRGAVAAGIAADAGVIFLFFLYGSRLSLSDAVQGMMRWKLHVAVLLSTFVLFPVLGLSITMLLQNGLPAALVTGIMFLCVLPSTVQSSIAFTSIARGNVPAAICAASASNLLGVIISPFLASWLLQTQGAELSFSVFRDIILLLLAPFVAGQIMRRWIGDWVQRHKAVLGYADRGSILVIIYVAFSRGVVDRIWNQLDLADLFVLLLLLAILLTIVLATTSFLAKNILHLAREDQIVLQFCGSKKSLASGLPMAAIIFSGPKLGMIVIPLMIFHQMQLIACAVLSRKYASVREDTDQRS